MERVIRADSHPTLRRYVTLPKNSSTEVDTEYSLYPTSRQMVPMLDEIELK